MRVFLVDFENVHNDGLSGIDLLTEDDEAVIFYSANADSISFELLHKLMFCKAKLNYYKVRRGGKNALDFQLSTFLGYKLKINPEAEYYIISKDNGFDFVIDFWSYGYVDVNPIIRRFAAIKTVLNWLTGQASQNAADKAAAVRAVEKLIAEEKSLKTTKTVKTVIKETEVSKENKEDKNNNENNDNNDVLKSEIKSAEDLQNTQNGEMKDFISLEQISEETNPVPKNKRPPVKKKTPAVKNTENTVIPLEISEIDLEIIEGLKHKAKSTHDLYILCVKQFGQKKGMGIYAASKPQYVAMLKNNGKKAESADNSINTENAVITENT